jgi:hypothetical protein
VAAHNLLTALNVPGMVWTLDALHTAKDTARLITGDLDGHYVLIIKGNQPIAHATAAALLAGPDSEGTATTSSQDDRGHGRVERRTIRVAPADDTLFPGAAQAFRLRRDTGARGDGGRLRGGGLAVPATGRTGRGGDGEPAAAVAVPASPLPG